MKNVKKTVIAVSTIVCTLFLAHNPSEAQNRNSEEIRERNAAKKMCYERYRSSLDIARCIKKVNKQYNYNPGQPRSDWTEEQWQRYEERLQRNVDGVRYQGN